MSRKIQRHERAVRWAGFASLAVGLTVAAQAGEIEWPSDFATQVENHQRAVAPAASQIATATKGEWSRAAVRSETLLETAFDTRALSEAFSSPTTVITSRGLILIVK